MANYVIASKPGVTSLAECLILGEFLAANCPDVTVNTAVKDPSEWDEFADSVCRSYGFESKFTPLVYTMEGTLIGGTREFAEHIKEKYDKMLTVHKDQQRQRARLVQQEVDEHMRRKTEGDTVDERVQKALE